MDQRIFSMNLAVETVSLYLLCCAVADAGAAITMESLAARWNGNMASLAQELDRLAVRNIIRRDAADSASGEVYRLVAASAWR